MEESTLTKKGQTTLPKAVREALGLKPGDKVRYRITGDGDVRIVKPRKAVELIGMLGKPKRPPLTDDEIEEAIAEAAVRSAIPDDWD